MNNKLLIMVGGVVVIGGIAAYFIMKNPSDTTSNQESTSQSSSLRDLAAASSPQKCDVTQTVENSESTGTVYIANGKIRGDFTSVSSGQTVQSHFVSDGEYSYTWSDSMTMGFKAKIAQGTAVENSGSQGVNMDQAGNYSCSAWSPDSSVFEVPAGIQFRDAASMGGAYGSGSGTVEGNAGNASDAKAMQCQACDGAPEPSRSQCRAALACN